MGNTQLTQLAPPTAATTSSMVTRSWRAPALDDRPGGHLVVLRHDVSRNLCTLFVDGEKAHERAPGYDNSCELLSDGGPDVEPPQVWIARCGTDLTPPPPPPGADADADADAGVDADVGAVASEAEADGLPQPFILGTHALDHLA